MYLGVLLLFYYCSFGIYYCYYYYYHYYFSKHCVVYKVKPRKIIANCNQVCLIYFIMAFYRFFFLFSFFLSCLFACFNLGDIFDIC